MRTAPLFPSDEKDAGKKQSTKKHYTKSQSKSYPYAVAFKVWGKLAHFRVPETTSSRMTYPIPSKPTVLGMVASIMGLRKFEYLELFKEREALVSVVYEPEAFNIMSMGIKLINTKNAKPTKGVIGLFSGKNTNSLVNHAFVKNPKYTIFLTLKDKDMLDELVNRIKDHRSVFHFYLGKAVCFGNFGFLDNRIKNNKFKVEELKSKSVVSVVSAVPRGKVEVTKEDWLSPDHDIAIYRMPLELDVDRTPLAYENFVLDKKKISPFEGRVLKDGVYGVRYEEGAYAVLY